VPVDAQLERSAVARIVSKDPPWRIREAIDSLQYFKSDANISLLKSLLNDPASNTSTRAESNNGIELREFPVRKQAYDLLKKWSVSVDPPVLTEEVPRFDTVTWISWKGPVTDDALEKLVAAGNLRDLSFGNKSLTDHHLSLVGQIRSLTRLVIRRQELTTDGLSHLQGLSSLQELDLDSSNFSNDALRALAGIPHLQRLVLANTPISDAAIVELQDFPELGDLDLAATQVTNNGLKELSGLRHLRHLHLSRTAISDEGLTVLATLPELRSVELQSTRTTKEGISKLRKSRPTLKVE